MSKSASSEHPVLDKAGNISSDGKVPETCGKGGTISMVPKGIFWTFFSFSYLLCAVASLPTMFPHDCAMTVLEERASNSLTPQLSGHA